MILMLADAGSSAVDAGAFAVLALAPIGVIAAVVRTRTGHVAPVGGIVLALVALLALTVDDRAADPGGTVLVAIALAAAIGLVDDARTLPFPVFAAALVVPAVLVAMDGPSGDVLVRGTVAVTVALGVPAIAGFDRRWHREAYSPALLAGTVVGLYLTVPDTEEAVVLVTCAIVVAVLGWPLRLVRIGSGGAAAAVVLCTWVAMTGGRARDGAVIGACAAVGLLVVEPAVRALGGRSPIGRLGVLRAGVLLLGVHAAAVLWASRVAGFRQDAPGALGLGILGLVAVGSAWAVGGTRSGPRPPARPRTRTRTAVRR